MNREVTEFPNGARLIEGELLQDEEDRAYRGSPTRILRTPRHPAPEQPSTPQEQEE